MGEITLAHKVIDRCLLITDQCTNVHQPLCSSFQNSEFIHDHDRLGGGRLRVS